MVVYTKGNVLNLELNTEHETFQTVTNSTQKFSVLMSLYKFRFLFHEKVKLG